jgi:hypothetical protein
MKRIKALPSVFLRTPGVTALVIALLILPLVFAVTHRSKKVTRKAPLFNRHAVAAYTKKGGEAPRGAAGGENDSGPANERRAFPGKSISLAQQQAAYQAFQSIARRPGGKRTNWQLLGPETGTVPAPATYTGRATINSGRLTALAVSPDCHANACKIFTAAAGGGIWEADNALAQRPNWHPSSLQMVAPYSVQPMPGSISLT